MQIVRHSEIAEINKCFQCDCETIAAGICTWQGEPCLECFDVATYCHLQSNPNRPGLFERNSANHQNYSPENRPQKGSIKEIMTDGNGDCLYECIARALSTTGTSRITISELRAFVSRNQTEDTFNAYKIVAKHDEQGSYNCLKKVRTLRGLKNVIQRCGAHVGAENCLWGDENALHILSNGYRLRFAIFDNTGKIVQLVEPTQHNASRTVLLRLHRQIKNCEHFNLLTFNDHTLLHNYEWNVLKQLLA